MVSNIIKNILEFADIKSQDLVLEIGPGRGALTHYIFNYTNNVILIFCNSNVSVAITS